MKNMIRVIAGSYRGQNIEDKIFPIIRPVKSGKKGEFVTVDGREHLGPQADKIRITLDDYEILQKHEEENQDNETDEEIMERIEERFDIVNEMTNAVVDGTVRAMMISGPPGVGKSYGVHKILRDKEVFEGITGKEFKYEVVKGAMTPIGLYVKLFEFSNEGNVLVFDDCDSVLFDELSLNLLKAALDTSKTRYIMWNTDSHKLKNEDVPNSFEFKGSVIFISNIKLDNLRNSRIRDHIEAVMSRSHVIDVALNTMRDKVLRIKQIAKSGALFQEYGLTQEQEDEVIEFMIDKKDSLREMSLRMAIKLADLRRVNGQRWKRIATITCMK